MGKWGNRRCTLEMGRIGVIVDGSGDYHSIRMRFTENCRVLKTDGPRGHEASVSDIVSGAGKQISMLIACEYMRIVVVTDFEMRDNDYNEFTNNLKRAFQNSYGECDIDVAVPNRMIENWYLADIEHLSKNKVFLKKNIRQKNFEGTNGKEKLKAYFLPKYHYSETIHGPQLFAILRFGVARGNSPSFNEFLTIMEKSD